MKTLLKYALFVIAVSFVLAGCGQGSDSNGESASESETEETSGSTVDSESSPEESPHDHSHNHSHDRDHEHSHSMSEEEQEIYDGWFEDNQVKDRSLSDWEGDWQSVYPYLQDGTLDEVFSYKAEEGEKTAEGYKEYYTKGYKTDVDRIVIDGQTVTFHENGEKMSAEYAYDGYEILEYEAGNRGVRYIFQKEENVGEAPTYIQFSDHGIAPKDAYHYHLYWGDDRGALLEEVTHWPTYYPSDLSGEEIVEEMKAH
ncbi:ZinT family metal-binding protein [Salibacterium lacus]|uniref:ZinT family metal-binding protein n=1 Tax=Salibacterium lacus TaxID=1898109 RepID=A0ABW5T7I0_9BACI